MWVLTRRCPSGFGPQSHLESHITSRQDAASHALSTAVRKAAFLFADVVLAGPDSTTQGLNFLHGTALPSMSSIKPHSKIREA